MEHATGLAHFLYRVAEEIHKHFLKIDNLISNVTNIFFKFLFRVLKFKEMAPGILMSSQPILTRWGTCLSATVYYCEIYRLVKLVVMKFDKDDAAPIENAQKLMTNSDWEFNLTLLIIG